LSFKDKASLPEQLVILISFGRDCFIGGKTSLAKSDVSQKYMKMTKDAVGHLNKQIKTSSIEEMDKAQSI